MFGKFLPTGKIMYSRSSHTY